jgi:serine/threonine protein phosphatase PrpC
MSFLKRLFSRRAARPSAEAGKTQSREDAKTAPLNPAMVDGAKPEVPIRHLTYGAAQSKGMERDHNEDALFILTGHVDGQESMPDFGLFMVADGMGGHRSGEVASAISVRTVAKHLTADTILSLFDPDGHGEDRSLHEMIRAALEDANQSVVTQVPGGGTTLTALILLGEQLTIGHVGDSRAYVIDGKGSQVITRDHSLVERLRELGQLTPDEAATHPQRNVLYRAIGQGANLEVDVVTHPVPHGGYVLLCSDGLWGVITDEAIQHIIHSAPSPQLACEELVRAANAAGGPDNITALLIYFPPE